MRHNRELCKKIGSILSEYLDEELDPISCKEVMAHMQDCPPCLAFLKSLQTSIELTRTAGAPGEQIQPLTDEIRNQLRSFYERSRTRTS